MCNVSRVTYQVSHVRCHMSGVTCNFSCVLCYNFSVGGVSINKAYSGLVFWLFVNKKRVDTQYLLISACSGPILVNKKSQLMRIENDGIGYNCQKCQIFACAETAPCAHFQKLDIGIKKISYFNLDIFSWVTWLLLHGLI